MVWACFSYHGVGPIRLIEKIRDQYLYVNMNDPKHTSKVAKEWFRENRIEVMVWPAQSPDLNPIENLWTDLKKAVWDEKPTNNKDLWEVVQKAWYNIPLERCRRLVDSMKDRCVAVIKNNGNATKY
uniref:Transposable element Tc1 transposase n=1 Tax=Bactrocera latifrons TaxID=174628 RepID=A0A0K8UJC9_BACLA